MNKLIGLAIILILVIFLFVYTNTQKSTGLFFGINQTASASGNQHVQVQAKDDLATDIISLRIQDKQIVAGQNFFRVINGHMIVLQITSDEPGDFYLAGYDKHVYLQKGKMVVLSFLSTSNGRFVYELANIHKVLGTMTVTP